MLFIPGNCIDDTVGSHLMRVVVADRHAGLESRADDDRFAVARAPRDLLPGRRKPGNDRGHDDLRDVVEGQPVHAEQPRHLDPQLVSGERGVGRNPPMADQLGAFKQAENGLGIADVNSEQHE